jgi:nitrous oxide reductase accessory protein NosL
MRFLVALTLAALVAGCSAPRPTPVKLGEACWRCRAPIQQAVLAAEFVQTANGLASKFRTVHCMSTWIAQQGELPKGHFYVTDYSTGEFVRAERASYVNVVVSKQTMARDYFAFADPAAAAAMAAEAGQPVVGWDDILAVGREQPLGGN